MRSGADALRRLTPWLILVVAAALVLGLFVARPRSFFDVGINTYGYWFLDSFAILASNDALALGLNVYAPNPLDIFHRPHVYSSWWLWLGRLGLTRADTLWVSLVLVGGFVVVTLALLRPKTLREAAWQAAIFLSPPMLLAINRANNDLVVYLMLAALPACVLSPSRVTRLLAPVLIAFATGLKYYPAAAALLLLAGRERREAWRSVVVQGALFVLVAASIAPDLRRLPSIVPHTEGLMTFGATAIPSLLGWSLGPWTIGTCALGLAAFAWLWVRGRKLAPAAQAEAAVEADELRFVMGAALLCACFWLGMNHGYRWIFAVWLAPWLWHRSFGRKGGERDALARATCWLLLAVLWTDSLIAIGVNRFMGRVPIERLMHWANCLYALEQPVTWAFFLCLLALLVRFLRTRTVLAGPGAAQPATAGEVRERQA